MERGSAREGHKPHQAFPLVKGNRDQCEAKKKSLNLSGLDSREGSTIVVLTSGGYLPLLIWDNARWGLWVIPSTSIFISVLSELSVLSLPIRMRLFNRLLKSNNESEKWQQIYCLYIYPKVSGRPSSCVISQQLHFVKKNINGFVKSITP